MPRAVKTQSGLAAKFAPKEVDSAPHLVVEAYAGTGKTFTQIVGVAWAFGQAIWPKIVRTIAERINEKAGKQKVDPNTFQIVPSAEQQAVWDSLALSAGKVKTITYCAFNKSIVTEFGSEWGWLVTLLQQQGISLQFATVNALGHRAVTGAYGRVDCKEWHTENVLAEHLGKDPRELKKFEPVLVKGVCELVGLCKLTLAGWTEADGFDPDNVTEDILDDLTSHFDIELNGTKDRVYKLVPEILRKSMDVETTREMDFNDQNWLPLINNLPVNKVDLLLVDEGQDLPRCKQEFARKLGRRIVLVGDINQAIYGFAGADVDSIPRMRTLLGNGIPLTALCLTETRRCSKAIVKEAQKIVPGFKAHADNSEGVVRYQTMTKYTAEAADRDMVLCRVNAPLVSQALRFVRDGRKAVIRGRDFGGSLINFVKKQKATSITDLLDKVDAWLQAEIMKETRKKNPSENRIINLHDRVDCVNAFCDTANTVDDVLAKMELVFAGKMCPCCKKHYNETTESCYPCKRELVTPEGVLFSSIHRAKGLEADRVFILLPKGAEMPHPMAKSAWQKKQEWNCLYIAITRGKDELVYVQEERKERD